MPGLRLLSCLATLVVAAACSSGQPATTGTGTATSGSGTGAPTAGAVCTPRCGQNQTCQSGAGAGGSPACECRSGYENCAAAGSPLDCVNEQTDNDNCGSCGNPCTDPFSCKDGTCQCVPSKFIASCGGTCADIRTDPLHCGGCGKNNVCGADQQCIGDDAGDPSSCLCNDTSLQSCSSVCINTTNDPLNCGGCDAPCMLPDSGGPAVACLSDNGGTCDCHAPWEQCQQATPCVDITRDPNNCGGCFNLCVSTDGTAICDAGSCRCGPDGAWTICPDSTCPDVQNDVNNCGSCGRTCFAVDAGVTCTQGNCFCGPNLDRSICPDSSCPDLQNDPRNCGTCGHPCFLPTPYCVAGSCADAG